MPAPAPPVSAPAPAAVNVTPIAVTATATTATCQTPQVIHQTPAVPTQADLAHMTPEQQMAHLQMMQKKQQAAAPQRKVIPVKRDLAGPPKEKETKKGSKGGIRAFFGFGKKKKPTVEHTVSDPFNMKHNVHVDFTTKTGFVGLPSEWESTLLSSGVNIIKKQSSHSHTYIIYLSIAIIMNIYIVIILVIYKIDFLLILFFQYMYFYIL